MWMCRSRREINYSFYKGHANELAQKFMLKASNNKALYEALLAGWKK